MRKQILIIFGVFVSYCGLCIDLTKTNLSYLYDVANTVTFDYRLVRLSEESLTVFSTVDAAFPTTVRFLTQESYDSEEHTEIAPMGIDTLIESGEYFYKYDLRIVDLQDLLLFETTHDSTIYYFPIEVDLDRIPGFYPRSGGPVVKEFSVNTPTFENAASLFAYKYGDDFGKADPPFGNMQALSPVIKVDTVMPYSAGMDLEERAFYFVQEDTSSSIGVGFLKVPPYYPRYRRIEELVAPLEYICSNREFGDIISSSDLRVGFEDFWINVANGKSGGKRAIRNYYRGVAMANLLFTNYKPGWQTDQGMIYLIYGAPDQVKRTDRKETWGYVSGEVFEFVKISTLFTPALYTLIRNPDFRDSWTERIKQIRAGL